MCMADDMICDKGQNLCTIFVNLTVPDFIYIILNNNAVS